MNSFLTPNDYALKIDNALAGQYQVIGTTEVPVRTVDEILTESEASRVFLKMDTQGFDLEVLRGADTCLDRIIALQTEATVRPLYKDVPTFIDTYEVLTAKGFDATGMFPLSWDDQGRVLEFDFVFVNSALL